VLSSRGCRSSPRLTHPAMPRPRPRHDRDYGRNYSQTRPTPIVVVSTSGRTGAFPPPPEGHRYGYRVSGPLGDRVMGARTSVGRWRFHRLPWVLAWSLSV